MPKPFPFSKVIPTKYYILVSCVIIALIVALHLFMVYAVLPSQGGSISLYIPAKSGGKDFFIDVDDFLVVAYIALGFAVLASIAVQLLLRANKRSAATVLMLWLNTLSMIYLATYGGNALDEMWGTLPMVLGVVAVAIAGFSLSFPLIGAMADSVRKRPGDSQ